MTWVLIIIAYIYIPLGGGVSVSVATVPGYTTQQSCQDASVAVKKSYVTTAYCIVGPNTNS